LATQIGAAEAVVRDPRSTRRQVAEAGLTLQVAYRALGAHPEWDDAVLAALPPELHGAVTINAAARREFRGMHTVLSENLPAWRIVEPAPAEDLLRWYQEAEAEFGVPWSILAAVNLVETGMGRIRGVSIAGAQGPMQFMPPTWEAYGEGDVNDPRDAIRGAARYLAANGGGSGDLDNALWHYNHSNRYVRGVRHYASLIAEHPQAFLAYYHWGIFFLTAHGDVYLPVGYEEHEPVPVLDYLAR
jgi:membrane-bound lytic murein transglycosylase B